MKTSRKSPGKKLKTSPGNIYFTGFLQDILHQRLVETYSSIGFMGATDMKFIGHARRGQFILYEVQLNQVFGTLFHSVVKAYTDNKLIAQGTLVSANREER